MDLASSFIPVKKLKSETDFSVCLICQKSGTLVGKPTASSYDTLLCFIRDRAGFGESDFIPVDFRLTDETAATLQLKGASWHRECYGQTCHKQKRDRARERFEKALLLEDNSVLRRSVGRPENVIEVPDTSQALPIPAKLTRSSFEPFNERLCFFCQTVKPHTLHEIASQRALVRLQQAVEQSCDVSLKLRLDAAVSSDASMTTCVKYHDLCWRNNVDRLNYNLQKQNTKQTADPPSTADSNTSQPPDLSSIPNDPVEGKTAVVAADMEFMSLLELLLHEGAVLTMADLHKKYVDIRKANGISNPDYRRFFLKQKISNHIKDIQFSKPKRRNESEYVYTATTRDEVLQTVAGTANTVGDDMKTVFDASQILRKAISSHIVEKPWNFNGSLSDTDLSTTYPDELRHFLRWVILGPTSNLDEDKTSDRTVFDKEIHSTAQSVMFAFKTKRQISRESKSPLEGNKRHVNEWPMQLAVGLSVHQATRSRSLLEILNGFGVSVDYKRILKLETQIAEEVCNQMAIEGVYIPPFVQQNRFVFFAIDNSDFNEDTPDGKRTTHATATVVYQQTLPGDEDRAFSLQPKKGQNTALRQWSEPVLQECHIPAASKPNLPANTNAAVVRNASLVECHKQTDVSWLFARSFNRKCNSTEKSESENTIAHAEHLQNQLDTVECNSDNLKAASVVPTWSAFNSSLADVKPKTKYGPLPLLYAPAHEWSTLITVLKQAQHISCKTTGPNSKAVITLDMQLYEKAKKLQLYREDCKDKWVLRIGELHTVMAALRTLGTAIEGSGLDDCWIESDIYGPATVRQILECGHMKRSLYAHIITLQALFDLYKEEFFSQCPDLENHYQKVMEPFKSMDLTSADNVRELMSQMQSLLVSELNPRLELFHAETQKPMFKVMVMYMNMVMLLLNFIRATRDALWDLHLATLEGFARFFFAFDRLKYARMVPVYISDMKSIQSTDPDIWDEFEQGNFVVNKSDIPFCAIGPDHGIEHVNRSMKVTGGLVGITLNEAARARFFLAAPELSRLSEEAKGLVGVKKGTDLVHHESSPRFAKNQDTQVMKLRKEISKHMNPFSTDSDNLVTIVTQSVMPQTVTQDMVNAEQIGLSKHVSFVENRIASNVENIWAPMKKTNLSVWKSVNKKTKLKVANQIVELKSERSLFARLVVVAKSRPEIDIKDSIGKFEFTTFPRSLFDGSGNLLAMTNKSQLLNIIEKSLETKVHVTENTTEHKACVIDGMALVQEMGKPSSVSTCLDLAEHFLERLATKTETYAEIHLVFDRYDIDMSLKTATRKRRLGESDKVSYKVTDTTSIKNTPMKKFLSHDKTKDRLCVYLSHHANAKYANSSKVFVVSFRNNVLANRKGYDYLSSSHEEADTKIILHAHHAAVNGVTTIDIHSPDTDVFILALRRLPLLAPNTSFVTGTGDTRRSIPLKPIYETLGISICNALPGFHALSGCDQTGKFAGKGKLLFWKSLMSANEEMMEAFCDLGSSNNLSDKTVQNLEKFICRLYAPSLTVESLDQLRWKLFSKRQAEGENLPPTQESLKQAIYRAHYQALVWQNDIVPNPTIPPPDNYGWRVEDNMYVPVSSELPAAPDAVVELVKCSCRTSLCSSSCSCRRNNLSCTEMCQCEGDPDACNNVYVLETDNLLDDIDDLII